MKKAFSLLALAVTLSFVSCSGQASDASVSVTNNTVQSENKSEAVTKASTEISSASEDRSISDIDESAYMLEADQVLEQYFKSSREENEEAFEYMTSHEDLDHKHSLDKKCGVHQKYLKYFLEDLEYDRKNNIEYQYDTEYIGKLDEALYDNVDMYYWNDYGWYEIRNQYKRDDDPKSHINVLRGYEYELNERRVQNGEVIGSNTEHICVIFVEEQGWKILFASPEDIESNDHYKTDKELGL
jgi:hypothetical protein